jgi:KUP system potassium uptake protein
MSSVSSSPGDLNAPKAALVIGALGVVFGDIGTSPLYALNHYINPSRLTFHVVLPR